MIRGWAFSAPGRSIRKVQLILDGAPLYAIPCCSTRGDVAAGFPNDPNALASGFGIAVNYGGLTTGVHTLAVRIEDSAGSVRTFYKGVLAKRPGNFPFLDQLDLSAATVRIANGALVVEGAQAHDKTSQQTASRILRYRFDVSAQAFLLTEDNEAEIVVTNTTSCEVNGNVSSLTALKQNPGADGISLPEVIQAMYNTPSGVDVLVTWQSGGTFPCSSIERLTNLTRGHTTLDGDVDGDGLPDVTLDGSAVVGNYAILYINASNTTVRHLRVLGNGLGVPVFVGPQPGTVVANVALIGMDVTSPPPSPVAALGLDAAPTDKPASLNDVLVSGGQWKGGIAVGVDSSQGSALGELHRVTIAENVITAPNNGIDVATTQAQKALLTQITVTNNTIANVNYAGILFHAGAGYGAATGNMLAGTISGNIIRNTGKLGIAVAAGDTGQGATTGNTVVVDIEENHIDAEMAQFGGIIVFGGNSSNQDANSPSTNNMVTATIAGNEVQNSPSTGISVAGSLGQISIAVQNSATVDIHDNAIEKSKLAAIQAAGGWSASDSMAEVMIANNTATSAGSNGIEVDGGTAQDRGDNNQGASSNTAMGTIQGNTVQGTTGTDIAVFGGVDNTAGAVTGNLAVQTIGPNTAQSRTCQDGLAGNKAKCTYASASTEARTEQDESAQLDSQGKNSEAPVPAALRPLLNQLASRVEDLHNRAQAASTPQLRAELLRLAERLEGRAAQVAARRRGQ